MKRGTLARRPMQGKKADRQYALPTNRQKQGRGHRPSRAPWACVVWKITVHIEQADGVEKLLGPSVPGFRRAATRPPGY